VKLNVEILEIQKSCIWSPRLKIGNGILRSRKILKCPHCDESKKFLDTFDDHSFEV